VNPTASSARFINVDRQQCVLRPIDVEALIGEDHVVRTLWKFLGTLDLSRFRASPKAVHGHAGRPAWEPRLLIAVWLYGLMRGVSSARSLARESAYEPGLQWLTGLQEINHHSLSDLRVDHGSALDELFAQVLGILHRHELITLERVTQDGTKVRADVDKSTFGRREALAEHLELARKHVAELNQQASEQEQVSKREKAARERAGREREQRLQAAIDTVDRLQKERLQDKAKPCQASPTDTDAQFMRTGDHGLAPCHNVQLSCDAAHKLIVSVAVTSQPSDSHQLAPALDRIEKQWSRVPRQMIADGDYTNRSNVVTAAQRGVDFYGSWGALAEAPAPHGIAEAYRAAAFRYDSTRHVMICPQGQELRAKSTIALVGEAHHQLFVAPREVCQACPVRGQCSPQNQMPKHGRAVSRLVEDPKVALFHAKMATEEAKAIYKQRSPVAEFPNAWLKTKLGLTRFRTRGRARVKCEVILAALTYNLQQLFRLRPLALT
jgi:transposase